MTTRQDLVTIRPCEADDAEAILTIINAAAEAYRGAIPDDCWHEPYFPAPEFAAELAAGVVFWGAEADGGLVGVMGLQRLADVDLVRHAYVSPSFQGRGVGGALLAHLRRSTDRPILIGTWAAAGWAIGFYQQHGFHLVGPDEAAALLNTYWKVSARQAATSVVLADRLFKAQPSAS